MYALMGENGDTREDLMLPNSDMGEEIKGNLRMGMNYQLLY